MEALPPAFASKRAQVERLNQRWCEESGSRLSKHNLHNLLNSPDLFNIDAVGISWEISDFYMRKWGGGTL